MRSSTTYTESLYTLDDREGKNYEENKEAIKPTEVHLRKQEQGYMKEQREVEENHLAQQPPWIIYKVHFFYDGDSSLIKTMRKNSTF